MTGPQAKATSPRWIWRTPLRLLMIFILAFAIGAVLNRVAQSIEADRQPAGFFRGMLQGALMPMAFPNLLVGKDVTIYSQENNGVHYKLGYTAGVNGCGAVFFGFFFWRINRWRRGKGFGR